MIAGTNQSNIVSAIGSACNGNTPGTVIFPNGSYSVNSAIMVPGNCTLQAANQGGATLNANQNQVFAILANNVTINGLIINGGWVAFGGANSYAILFSPTIQSRICGSAVAGVEPPHSADPA